MKKWFIFAAAMLFAVYSCENEPVTPEPEPTPDAVSINPTGKSFGGNGGTLSALVTSTGTWTLTGEYDWAHPSARTGKDGDAISFVVDANETETPKEGTFTLTVGEATATITLKLAAKDEPEPDPETRFELITDQEMTIPRTASRIEIEIDSEYPYRDLTYTISEDATWLKYVIVLYDEDSDVTTMLFDATANTTFANRTATVTIFGGEEQLEVNVTQQQTNRLTTELPSYSFPLEGGSVDVQLLANVEYEYAAETNDWLTITPKADNLFTFSGPVASARREVKVTFTATDESLGLNPRTITIIQKPDPLITRAVDMTNNRLFTKWGGTAIGSMSTFTLEALVYVEEFKPDGNLNVIMGVEGKFLVRTGDSSVPNNRVQVCYLRSGNTTELKLTNSEMNIPEKEWTHIAVTSDYASKTIKCYINGVEKGSATLSGSQQLASVNFSPTFNNEDPPSGTITRNFWLGYGYEGARYWPGIMSEVRIWNKALTAAEINATNHFYKIDNPESNSNLVAYWKLNDGLAGTAEDFTENKSGDVRSIFKGVAKDHSSKGNDLWSWSPVNWVEVSAP